MELIDLGSLGYQIGAVGIVAFTFAFLVAVRWWTDWLGRVLAGVLSAMSGVLIIVTIRQLFPDLEGAFLVWRAVVFWIFGIAVWAGLGTFIWAQFFAPRIKGNRSVRKPDHTKGKQHEEADLADSGHSGDGDLHDRSGVAF